MRGFSSMGFMTQMCRLLVLAVVAWALPGLAVPPAPYAGSHPDLVQLTSQNWTQHINQGSWLIEFYSPFCAHCKAFLPLWKELTQNKANLAIDYPDGPFKMAQVNCYTQRQLCVDQSVPHFPKLTIYRDGQRSELEYQGDREYTELARWIDDQAHQYRSSKGVSHQPHPAGSEQRPLDDLPAAGPPLSAAQLPEHSPKAGPQFGTSTLTPPQRLEPSDSAASEAKPNAGLNDKQQGSKEAAIASPQSAPTAAPPPPPQEEIIDESMPNPRGQLLTFGVTPGLKTLDELREWLGVTSDSNAASQSAAAFPSRIGVNANEGNEGTGSTQRGGGNGGAHLHYGHGEQGVDDAAVASALNPDSPMRTRLPLRKDTVSKGGTFVKFYAPWCPHCKAMAQAFAELAPSLKNRLNILEVDCQAHSSVCNAFAISGYPTLRLYSPTNKLVSEYRGSRSFEAMRTWCAKAAEEEGIDLPIARDETEWAKISQRDEVRFLWLTDGSDLDAERGVDVASWEEERDLVTSASKGLFTSPFRVYRSSHGALAGRFQSWFGPKHKGFKSVILAFKDHKSDRPVAAYHIRSAPTNVGSASQPSEQLSEWRRSERHKISAWLDWNRYPTISQVGGDSWTDVINNRHGAPVVLALLSDEHHDGQTYPTGSGSARREAEVAALKRMALAWRDSKRLFLHEGQSDGVSAESASLSNAKLLSDGGLLWGWIDADRWRKAIYSYYSLKEASQFPALLLIDGPSMLWYPLPTRKPSELIDAAKMDSPTGKLAKAISIAKAQDYGFKVSYAGVSSQISTWLGQGAASGIVAADRAAMLLAAEDANAEEKESLENVPLASDVFVDDLRLLDEIEAIGKGQRKYLARSSRSYLDRGYRRLGSFVSWGSRHPILSTLFFVCLLITLAVYVKRSSQGGSRRLGTVADPELGDATGEKRKVSPSTWWETRHSNGTKVD